MTTDEVIDAIARDVHALVSTGPQPDTLLIPAYAYHALMDWAERALTYGNGSRKSRQLFDLYLDWCRRNRKERRARAQARKKKRGWL